MTARLSSTSDNLSRCSAVARRSSAPACVEEIELSPYDPRAQLVTWFSPSLGVPKRMHLYLPPGYAGSREHYPVLYLLRGHEREWVNFREDASRQGENTLDVYERLLATGEVGPMILVMPSLTSDDGVWHGFGVDNLAPDVAEDAAGIGTGRWEQCLIDDLLPLVDSHWHTLTGGAYRGLAGFSLGGAVAVRLAAKYPELFASASAYDGSFFFADEETSSVRADDGILRNAIAAMAFGRVRDVAHATANSSGHVILRADAAALRRVTWMIQYGPEAIEPWGSNFYRGESLLAALRKRGISNAGGPGVLEGGDHTWRTADRHMAGVLPLHWRKLRAAHDS